MRTLRTSDTAYRVVVRPGSHDEGVAPAELLDGGDRADAVARHVEVGREHGGASRVARARAELVPAGLCRGAWQRHLAVAGHAHRAHRHVDVQPLDGQSRRCRTRGRRGLGGRPCLRLRGAVRRWCIGRTGGAGRPDRSGRRTDRLGGRHPRQGVGGPGQPERHEPRQEGDRKGCGHPPGSTGATRRRVPAGDRCGGAVSGHLLGALGASRSGQGSAVVRDGSVESLSRRVSAPRRRGDGWRARGHRPGRTRRRWRPNGQPATTRHPHRRARHRGRSACR